MTEFRAIRQGRMTSQWGLGTAVAALALTIVVAIVGESLFLLVTRHLHEHHQLAWSILGYQFLVVGVIVSTVFLVLVPRRLNLEAVGYRFPGWSVLLTAAASVVVILFAVAALKVLFDTFFPGYHLHGNANEVLPNKHPHLRLWQQAALVAWAALEAPLAEETLFRGILFQGIRETAARWVPYQVAVFAAAVVSGVVFGLVHNQVHTLPILIVLGIALAYIFQFSRSIFGSAIVHGIINGVAVLSLLHGT